MFEWLINLGFDGINGRNYVSKSFLFAISVKSGQIRNIESARVSMGGQVKKYVCSVFLSVHECVGVLI